MFHSESKAKANDVGLLADPRIHYFGATEFSYNVWVANKDSFYNPTLLSLNADQEVGKMVVRAYSGGSQKGSIVIDGGWLGNASIPWDHLSRGKSYSFYLKNESSSRIYLTGGSVWYDS
ncbi:hypothetical protein [Virgibacillus salexigens]|uniref:hypothetical protein n=1 Tax=Virgibacillus salexigens TaxID=61016 RepID=UPI003082026F